MRPLRRFSLAGLFTMVALAGFIAFSTSSSAPRAQAQTVDQVELGLSVQGGLVSNLTSAEATIGREVDFLRSFSRWNENFPTNSQLTTLNSRNLVLSVRPITGTGQPILWRDIADAQPGDPLHNDMVRWAQQIKPYQDQIWFSFNHEPETVHNIANGTDSDFIDAWRAFMLSLIHI